MIDLTFDSVSKRYLVQQDVATDEPLHPWVRRLKSLRRRRGEFWALRDVSFDVKRGETVGIIGHNGAGKSTILKLLSSITTPTHGEIRINGRLSALIEVGSGFHPELTGRENIYLNGAILGMRREEIASKLDSIVEFAGIRAFLDVPVKRFSSGMYVRLGFSIAAHLDPDILLLDEVLAVGDAAFQEKCLARISELHRMGTTIVFISHDLGAVERICDRVILMKQGEIVSSGSPRDVIAEYQEGVAPFVTNTALPATTSSKVTINSLKYRNSAGKPAPFLTGEPLCAAIDFSVEEPVADVVFDILIYDVDREGVCQFTTDLATTPIMLRPGQGTLTFSCDALGIMPGMYFADVSVRERGAPEALNWLYRAASLRVDPGPVVKGRYFQSQRWTLTEK